MSECGPFFSVSKTLVISQFVPSITSLGSGFSSDLAFTVTVIVSEISFGVSILIVVVPADLAVNVTLRSVLSTFNTLSLATIKKNTLKLFADDQFSGLYFSFSSGTVYVSPTVSSRFLIELSIVKF